MATYYSMRATVDADVEFYLREAVQREGKSLKEFINDILRKVLRPTTAAQPRLLPPRSLGRTFCPDPLKLSQFADELEAGAYLASIYGHTLGGFYARRLSLGGKVAGCGKMHGRKSRQRCSNSRHRTTPLCNNSHERF